MIFRYNLEKKNQLLRFKILDARRGKESVRPKKMWRQKAKTWKRWESGVVQIGADGENSSPKFQDE